MHTNVTTKYRPDIDGLRAFAVTFVLLYHAFPDQVTGGFVGVDVFFVISGYLISQIILGSLEKGGFSFQEFYARRVRRIFPSLIVVLVAVLGLGWCFLLPDEFQQLGKSIASGAAFVSNFVRWKETGYFDTAAELKKLLHLWSLSVEEQFYILWPLILFLLYRFQLPRFPAMVFLIIGSFLINLMHLHTDASAMFYLPLSRFWELLVGSVLAYLTLYYRNRPQLARFFASEGKRASFWVNASSALGITLVLSAVFLFSKELSFPGYWALVPTLGTALVLVAGKDAWINRAILSNKTAIAFGLISYPVYLWHWPLLTYSRTIANQELPASVSWGCVLASFLLGWLTYRLIELPFKQAKHAVWTLSLSLFAVAVLGVVVWRSTIILPRLSSSPLVGSFAKQIEWTWWDEPGCQSRFPLSPCQVDTEKPTVLLLGDSHGNAVYPGLAERFSGVLHAGTCPPFDQVIGYSERNKEGSAPCFDPGYLDMKSKLVDRVPSAQVVVLAAYWGLSLSGEYYDRVDSEVHGRYFVESLLPSEKRLERGEVVFRGLSRTVESLFSKGKKVIFVRDVPELFSDVRAHCQIDRLAGVWKPDCTFPFARALPSRELETVLVDRLKARFPKLTIVDPTPSFCDAEQCYFIRDNQVLYRDRHHLALAGSRLIADALLPYLETP